MRQNGERLTEAIEPLVVVVNWCECGCTPTVHTHAAKSAESGEVLSIIHQIPTIYRVSPKKVNSEPCFVRQVGQI